MADSRRDAILARRAMFVAAAVHAAIGSRARDARADTAESNAQNAPLPTAPPEVCLSPPLPSYELVPDAIYGGAAGAITALAAMSGEGGSSDTSVGVRASPSISMELAKTFDVRASAVVAGAFGGDARAFVGGSFAFTSTAISPREWWEPYRIFFGADLGGGAFFVRSSPRSEDFRATRGPYLDLGVTPIGFRHRFDARLVHGYNAWGSVFEASLRFGLVFTNQSALETTRFVPSYFTVSIVGAWSTLLKEPSYRSIGYP
jgi:hypothetical protein